MIIYVYTYINIYKNENYNTGSKITPQCFMVAIGGSDLARPALVQIMVQWECAWEAVTSSLLQISNARIGEDVA